MWGLKRKRTQAYTIRNNAPPHTHTHTHTHVYKQYLDLPFERSADHWSNTAREKIKVYNHTEITCFGWFY